MTTHFHYGYGVTGYGPEEPSVCPTLECLGYCVGATLDDIAQGWADQAHGERYLIEQLKKDRPANGSEPSGYSGSWESIATAALRALECLDRSDDVGTLWLNLDSKRQQAPAYRGKPEAWEAELRRLLIDSGTYPLDTDLSTYHRLYVWECSEWRHLLSEHDEDYEPPVACQEGGGTVPCACRDCMDTAVPWSPQSGNAPYCDGCVEAGCTERLHGECDNGETYGDETGDCDATDH